MPPFSSRRDPDAAVFLHHGGDGDVLALHHQGVATASMEMSTAS